MHPELGGFWIGRERTGRAMTLNAKESGGMIASPVEIKWHAGLPIFASEAFLKTVGEEYGWLGGTDGAGQLRCVLPYTIVRKPGFRMVRFRVETIAWQKELAVHEEQLFLNNAIEYFRSMGADMVIPANNTALFRTYPQGAFVAQYGTFIKNLSQAEDVLWGELHSDYRQNIRKATKSGITISSGLEYLDSSYSLIADTLKRSGLSFRRQAQFNRMILGLGDNVKIFVAHQGGVIEACMVCPFSQDAAYDWYSGTIPKPQRGAMHMLVWEAFREFSKSGVKRFNFTGVRLDPEKGSKQEGIRNFKMRFGGELVQGYMWKYPFRPLKFVAYSVAEYLLMRGNAVRFRPASEVTSLENRID
jgi:Acetyltransferase (GNAT) domain